MVDELLNLAEWDEKNLETKISFLKKIKTRLHKTVKRESDQEIFQKQGFLDSLLKRSFDIIVAASAIIFLTPLFLLIAIAIRCESKGNILYISKRAGMGYRIFNFYKFRTMVADAEVHRIEFAHLNLYHNNAFFKINNDPRITRVGHLLRNTSLDELPQLFNVLLGDMSLVGNRPLPLYEARNLTTDALATRFMAPAGITGLWQIKKRGRAEMSVDERIELDIDYVNKSNFLYDLWIMANTPQALMQKVDT